MTESALVRVVLQAADVYKSMLKLPHVPIPAVLVQLAQSQHALKKYDDAQASLMQCLNLCIGSDSKFQEEIELDDQGNGPISLSFTLTFVVDLTAQTDTESRAN